VRIQRQVIRLRAVALEKPRKCLSGVHDFEISCIVDDLFVLVRCRRGRCYHLVFDTLEFLEERLIGLASKRAQHRRLVKARRREVRRVDIPVPDALIVGKHDLHPGILAYLLHRPYIDRLFVSQNIHGVPLELLSNAKRKHNQRWHSFMFRGMMAELQFLYSFT